MSSVFSASLIVSPGEKVWFAVLRRGKAQAGDENCTVVEYCSRRPSVQNCTSVPGSSRPRRTTVTQG